jgi:rare lipoprotein A
MKYILGILFLFIIGTTTKTGIASYYHNKFQGRKTASGERYDRHKLTAASNKFKIGDSVRVTNTKNGKSIDVTVNDRMANNGRLIDLSRSAADSLGFIKDGLVLVKVSRL